MFFFPQNYFGKTIHDIPPSAILTTFSLLFGYATLPPPFTGILISLCSKKVLWRWKKGDYFRFVVVVSLLDSAWLWAWDPYEIVPGRAISVWVRWEIFLLRATFNPSQPTSRLYQLRKRGVMCWCAACV